MESPGMRKSPLVVVGGRSKRKRFQFEDEFPSISTLFPGLPTKPSMPFSQSGPLIFNPVTASKSTLFSSSSLLPQATPLADHSLPRLASLRCPATNAFLLFFPTGPNSDRIGFLLLSVQSSGIVVRAEGNVDACGLNHQILRILVSPVGKGERQDDSSGATIGYLLASTMYSVCWFVVKLGSPSEVPSLVRANRKVFKTCGIVSACWSPHLPDESVVLLESGELYFFSLNPWLESGNLGTCRKGARMRFLPDCTSGWVSCEFSWHPKILIVARSDAVFEVDLSLEKCSVSCIMKIEMLPWCSQMEKERFLSLAKAGSDGSHFALVSSSLLVLCDMRRPFKPVLQWVHGLTDPCYVDVVRLADLRSNSRNDMYKSASESGFCIILGSFWTSQFHLFFYGPSLGDQSWKLLSKGAKFCKHLCAWDHYSALILSGSECRCGSCLMKEDFLKDTVPPWIEWQCKKEIVLGFSVIPKDLSTLLSEPDEFGGFTLVRLMSSGRIESQRYSASWNTLKKIDEYHNKALRFDKYLMCYTPEEKYKFPRKFSYLRLGYLNGHLDRKLSEVLDSKLNSRAMGSQDAGEFFSVESHKILCEKLNACGLSRARNSPLISVVFKDISSPSSIHEVALRRMWADLPIELLQMAFSHYSKILEVNEDASSLEFSVVPDVPQQLPPFLHKNPSPRCKWSKKVQCIDAFVGPVVPLPFLVALQEFYSSSLALKEERGWFSIEAEQRLRCDEVMKMARQTATASDFASESGDDHAVSLADDREETWDSSQATKKSFVLLKPCAFSSGADCNNEEAFGTLISRVVEKDKKDSFGSVGLEMFDGLCPVKLRFDDSSATDMGTKEMKAYKLLNKQLTKWQNGFDLYQEFCSRSKLKS